MQIASAIFLVYRAECSEYPNFFDALGYLVILVVKNYLICYLLLILYSRRKNIEEVLGVFAEKFVILQPKSVCCVHTLL